MAFQPFWVGTVMRIWTLPLASRTGRITPGMMERISGLAPRSRSNTSRTPSMILCSILSLPWAARCRNLATDSKSTTRRYNEPVAHQITLIPGDGIGPEVADATIRAVNATGVHIEWERVDAGVEAERRTGK